MLLKRPRSTLSAITPPPRYAVMVAWLALPIGVGIIGISMWWASKVTDPAATAHFTLFWAGVLTALVPASLLVMHPGANRSERVNLLVAIGVLTALPKVLAYPGGPAYFDEYAHWAQVERLHSEGLAFMANRQVVVIGDYPAMHLLASGIRHLTGLSTYHAGLVLVGIFHVLCILGVYTLGSRVSGSETTGGIAALWYGVGPGLWYFNAQFAYEAFGVTLFVWSIVALTIFISTDSETVDRDRWMIAGIAISVVLTATHHLSSYANAVVVGVFVLAVVLMRLFKRETSVNAGEAMIYGTVVVGVTVWWLVTQAPNTRDYLQPYIAGGLKEALKLGSGADEKSGGGTRELFAGSTIPAYEQILSFAVPLLSAAVFALSVFVQWLRGFKASAAAAMALSGIGFYAVYPLMLSETGAEGARRSWSFTNIGVAVIIALAAV